MSFIKKIGKSFLNLFLFSAIVHNLVLIYSALKTGDIKYLNYFRILGLDEFWSKISEGNISDLISFLIMLGIIAIFYLYESLKNHEH